jgi:transposase InsO family protein
MHLHANAKLGLAGRLALVTAIEEGVSLKRAAARFSVSPATAHRWWHRYLEGGRHRDALRDRSSRPRRSPRRLSEEAEAAIVRAREQTGYGPDRLAGLLRRAASTIWKVLRRLGLTPKPRLPRPRYRRYAWSRPGALLHVDVKELPRFQRPGHRVTGERRNLTASIGAGYQYLHCVVDDHSRFAYVELHGRQDAETSTRVLGRAVAALAELGLGPPEAVMTDNALVYTRSRGFRALLASLGARHIVTPPYTPRWNGKVERFIGTLLTEWAYVRTYASSSERARALSSFIRFYNRQRPHSSLGGKPPISRVHNVCGEDN